MRFIETPVDGVFIVETDAASDGRGSFERVYCDDTFTKQGLDPCTQQWSLSRNTHKGTLRGLHYQTAPHEESKLVRCIRGAVFDVAADIRADSSTFGKVATVELSDDASRALYIPPGVAHGFLTLANDSHILYGISPAYVPDAAAGIRFDDETLAVPWPAAPTVISDKDRSLPRLSEVLA